MLSSFLQNNVCGQLRSNNVNIKVMMKSEYFYICCKILAYKDFIHLVHSEAYHAKYITLLYIYITSYNTLPINKTDEYCIAKGNQYWLLLVILP